MCSGPVQKHAELQLILKIGLAEDTFFVCVLAVAYCHLLYWTANKSVTNVKAAQQGRRVTV